MIATYDNLGKDLRLVLAMSGIAENDLLGGCRKRELCLIRSAIANVWRKKYVRCTQMMIAVMLNRNRSTVSFYTAEHADWYKYDPVYRRTYEHIKQLIGGGEDENTY